MRINSKKNFKINSLNLTIILSIILFVVYSLWLGKMPSPFFTDEVGYWGCGAFFAGIDWTSVTSKMAYFGYGYGFFLFPLFLLGDSKLIYEGALVLNIFFIECVFLMLAYLLNKMFSKQYEIENIFCAFTSSMYSAYIVYSHTTMSETCILFFLVLLVVLLQKYCETPKIIYSVLIAMVSFELLAIHLRNIIFIAVTLFFLFCRTIKKKANIITVIFICCAGALAWAGKEYITRNVFTDIVTGTHIDVNDNVSERLWFVKQLLNIEWWKRYFINILCKSFYVILSSLFTVVLAVAGIIKTYRTQKNLSEKFFCIFLLLLLGASILYESLIMFAGSSFRIDMLFYGRYIECIMPVFCAIGLAYFCRMDKFYQYFKAYSIIVAVVLLISQVALSYYENNHVTNLNYINIMPLQITGFSWILKDKPENVTQMITLFAVLAYVLIATIIYFIIKNKYFSIVMIAVCWITFAYVGWSAFGLNLNETRDISTFSRVQRMEKINEVADWIRQLKCEEVYYIFNQDSEKSDFYDMFTLQFDLVTVKLLPISSDEIPKDGIIVVNYCSDYYQYVKEDEIIYENDLFIVTERK